MKFIRNVLCFLAAGTKKKSYPYLGETMMLSNKLLKTVKENALTENKKKKRKKEEFILAPVPPPTPPGSTSVIETILFHI